MFGWSKRSSPPRMLVLIAQFWKPIAADSFLSTVSWKVQQLPQMKELNPFQEACGKKIPYKAGSGSPSHASRVDCFGQAAFSFCEAC